MSSSQQDDNPGDPPCDVPNKVTPNKKDEQQKYQSFLSQPYDPIDGYSNLAELIDLNKKISKDVHIDSDNRSDPTESHEKPKIQSGKYQNTSNI